MYSKVLCKADYGCAGEGLERFVMKIFCTLFDSNYLDKGLVMYKSLEENVHDFKLYILAMDLKCLHVLLDLNCSNVTVISLEDFIESQDLQSIKDERSAAEFCWTCTPHLIDYVFEMFNEPMCTYIDADLYFYADCNCLLEEIGDKDAQIVEHRFTMRIEDQIALKESGKYCVEFNTFKNTENGRYLLNWWKQKCRESCSASAKEGVFGDQKYLEEWEQNEKVSVLKHLGGGVAPWNVAQYKLLKWNESDSEIWLKSKKTREQFEIIFYHFHNITYHGEREVDISVYQRAWGVDDELIRKIYIPYLQRLDEVKNMLKVKYNIQALIRLHPSFEGKISRKKGVKDLILSIKKKKGIKDIYILLYLNINNRLRKCFVEKKNVITF